MTKRFATVFLLLLISFPAAARCELKAGAAKVDVTPEKFPVYVNGGMTSRSVDTINTRIHARALVLDDGSDRIALVVVDSCMLPRPLLDDAKQLASQRTQIEPDRILISATHTHTAPSSMGALGTPADPTYVPYLRLKLAEAIAMAEANLEPAEVGWGEAEAAEYTALRRWIRRPDRIAEDPFGNLTVRANMHAGNNWDLVTGESGPEDPMLSLISVRAKSGRPIAVLSNFSMHYFGDKAIGADYFGAFCHGMEERLQTKDIKGEAPDFVAILSHGCSGDIWRRDYKVPAADRSNPTMDDYTTGLLRIALKAYEGIKHTPDADVGMEETRMTLDYRVPDNQRLLWAKGIVETMGDRLPKTQQEVYAAEQIILHERKSTEIVVQAIRIGDIGIATTPNETYALTGLKLKLQSPLPHTMVIELANGGDGYIPPPEQHVLGGYNTWAARSAGLEVNAEPKIVEAGLNLLEKLANRSRRPHVQSIGKATQALLDDKPVAFWRLDELAGPRAVDRSGNDCDGIYEAAVAYFLPGPETDICQGAEVNREAHFAGDRLRTRIASLGNQYTISMWINNGMPSDARETAGWFFSRDHDFRVSSDGEHLGVGGTATKPGKLVFQHHGKKLVGKTEIKRWTWAHVKLVRDEDRVQVYLNGQLEIDGRIGSPNAKISQVFFGGRSDGRDNWEGKLDEIAVYNHIVE